MDCLLPYVYTLQHVHFACYDMHRASIPIWRCLQIWGSLHMVQYTIFGNFHQNLRNIQNFDFLIKTFIWVANMSQNSSHTLGSYRMLCFLQVVIFRVRTEHPKLGVFSAFSKYSFLCCFITQLINKLQQWSLYKVIEDILPFVLNTKRPLSNI